MLSIYLDEVCDPLNPFAFVSSQQQSAATSEADVVKRNHPRTVKTSYITDKMKNRAILLFYPAATLFSIALSGALPAGVATIPSLTTASASAVSSRSTDFVTTSTPTASPIDLVTPMTNSFAGMYTSTICKLLPRQLWKRFLLSDTSLQHYSPRHNLLITLLLPPLWPGLSDCEIISFERHRTQQSHPHSLVYKHHFGIHTGVGQRQRQRCCRWCGPQEWICGLSNLHGRRSPSGNVLPFVVSFPLLQMPQRSRMAGLVEALDWENACRMRAGDCICGLLQ